MADMDDVIRAHTAGFNLEEVKVAFSRDVKIDVSDVHVEGKRGEILNMPRWVANVLESESHAEIQDADMVVELKQAIVKENTKDEFETAALDPHFYIRLKAHLARLPDRERGRVGSMLNSLVRKRRTKIVALADAYALTAEIAQTLTVEEQALYNDISGSCKGYEDKVLGGGVE